MSFPASAATNHILAAKNAQTDATGVYAVASGTDGSAGCRILSQDYGSNAFVSVTALPNSGAFDVTDRNDGQVIRTVGTDATATINGVSTTADGLHLKVSDAFLSLEVTLSEAWGGGAMALGNTDFTINEGGALFQLGPQVNTNLQENIGVQSVQANKLGNTIVGFLSDLKSGQRYALNTEMFKQASEVATEAIDQISVLRGRLGAFERDTLQPNIDQLQITIENLTSSQAVIRDTDFATETSELTRAQILVQAGNSILAIANAQSQNVLSLLGG